MSEVLKAARERAYKRLGALEKFVVLCGGGRACRLEDFDTSHFRGQDPGRRNALVVVLSLAGGGGIK